MPATHPPSSTPSMTSVAPRKFMLDGETLADELPDHAAGGLTQRAGTPVQAGEPAAREQHQRESADAHRGVDARAAFLLLALPEHHEAGHAQHDAEIDRRGGRTGRTARPTARRRTGRCDSGRRRFPPPSGAAGGGERRIVAMVRSERHQHHQRDHPDGDHRAFAQPAGHRRSEALLGLGPVVCGFCHLPAVAVFTREC